MDNQNTQITPIEEPKGASRSLKGWLGKIRIYGLRDELILPYLLLTILLAVIGTFIVIRLVASDRNERFTNQLYNSSRTAADIIRQQENTNLRNLRFLLSSTTLAEMVENRDVEQLKSLGSILKAYESEFISVVDRNGQEIITIELPPGTNQPIMSLSSQNFRDFDPVVKIFSSAEGKTEKHVGLIRTKTETVLVTSAAVRGAAGDIKGVLLVGTYVNSLLTTIKEQTLVNHVMLLDENYEIISQIIPEISVSSGGEATLAASPELENLLQSLKTQGLDAAGDVKKNLRSYDINQRSFTIYYSEFNIREEVKGWLGLSLSDDYQTSAITTSRLAMVLLFSIGTLAVIIIGYLLAQSIARPILKLRDLSKEVAGGNLNQRINIKRSDEIGELAEAFDQMTQQLRERTEEAARLFELTIQRNKELTQINAKLQSMQLQLIQAEKLAAVGQLTAGIVHDVKNPLAVVKGLSEVLLGNDLTDEERQQLKVIHESAVKANNIVTDLLKFARQSTPEKKFQDLRETVEASLRLTAYLSRKANVEVIKDLPDRAVMMWYDSQQLEQVFINIITNAIQAMPDKGTLRVSMRRIDHTVAISFQDTGIGIPAENLNRIFDPFFTTKPEGQGTGLGLSVSYGIVSNHNGHIQVESKVGEGSTFTVILPIDQSPSPQGVI